MGKKRKAVWAVVEGGLLVGGCFGAMVLFWLGVMRVLESEEISLRLEYNSVRVETKHKQDLVEEEVETIPPGVMKLVAVGDVMLGRSVAEVVRGKKDWKYPFLEVRSEFNGGVVFGNLESPLGDICPEEENRMIFCAPREFLEGLEWAGFRIMSLENNHNLNQGQEGLMLTEGWLEGRGILGVVEGEYEVVEENGVRVAVIAVDDVGKRVNEEALVELIGEAKKEVGLVVVSVHWGEEYKARANQRQERLGRMMVDSGASLVLGHHPHWVQNVEVYKSGLIVYSLGNFVFDQMWSGKTREGVIGKFKLTEQGVEEYEFVKVKIYDYAQPRLEDWEGEIVVEKYKEEEAGEG